MEETPKDAEAGSAAEPSRTVEAPRPDVGPRTPTIAPAAPASGPLARTDLRTARALFGARWSQDELEPGRKVELSATADGFEEGALATFTITRRGESAPLDEVEATIRAGEARVTWTPVEAAGGPGHGVELEFEVSAEGLASRAAAVPLVERSHVLAQVLVDHGGRPYADEEFVVQDAGGREVARGRTDLTGWLALPVPGGGPFSLRIVDANSQVRVEDPAHASQPALDVPTDPGDSTDHTLPRSQVSSTSAEEFIPDDDEAEGEEPRP
ncbi:MAG TPA: hypothetical protein VG389_09200 [Myxococcota bacterium]|nr:hypothetical protein [Myxococcota bacterium]